MNPEVIAMKVRAALEELLENAEPKADLKTLGVQVAQLGVYTIKPPGPHVKMLCTVIIVREVLRNYGIEQGVHAVHKTAFEVLAEHGTPSVSVSVIG